MNKEEARIILLEDALCQAQWTIEFLHNCLVNPVDENIKEGCRGYSYAYPNQTLDKLKKFQKLVKPPQLCIHSRFHEDCESCREISIIRNLLEKAKSVLND